MNNKLLIDLSLYKYNTYPIYKVFSHKKVSYNYDNFNFYLMDRFLHRHLPKYTYGGFLAVLEFENIVAYSKYLNISRVDSIPFQRLSYEPYY